MSALPVKDRPRPAAVSAAEVRQQLLDHRRAGRREAFIDLAYRYLATVRQDPPIVLDLLQALVELGLGDPARELIDARADLEAAGDAAALRKSLDSLPAAVVPWPALRQRFATNLDACLASRPHLQPLRSTLAAAVEGLELLQTTDGALHLGRRRPGRLREWVPGFGSDGADTMDLPLDAAGPAVAVIGTGLSPLAQRVHTATRPDGDGTAAPVFVLDDDPARAAAWLHALDLAELLADQRVGVFLGPDALPDYERFLLEHEDLLIPDLCLVPAWANAAGREAEAVAGRVTGHRGREAADFAARLAQRARERSIADWGRRLRPGATVLGFTSRATTMLQYSMRDIGDAFEALGYRFRLVIERGDHCRHSALTTSRAIWENDPALVVLINHFRHEHPEAMGGGPILTWIQDPNAVVLSKHTGESIGPLDFVCGHYHHRCTGEFGYPASRFFIAPLPVSTTTFHDGAVEPGDAARYACDVMYIGHLHDTADEHLARWWDKTPARLHPMLDRIREEITSRHARGEHAHGVQPIVQAAATEFGFDLQSESIESVSNYFAHRLYDILFRQETLTWVARWAQKTGRRFRLYGRGWSRDPVLAPFAEGPVEHGEEARRAYHGAKATIQTIPSGLTHQRTFEALLSGSLALGRWCPVDFGGLTPAAFRAAHGDGAGFDRILYRQGFRSLDRIVFDGPGALEERLERTVSDEPWRRALIAQLRQRVLEHYTYDAVIPPVIEFVRQGLRQGAKGL